MVEVRSNRRTEPAYASVRWTGAYKWGGYWHTLMRRPSAAIGAATPRLFNSPEAARKAARQAGAKLEAALKRRDTTKGN